MKFSVSTLRAVVHLLILWNISLAKDVIKNFELNDIMDNSLWKRGGIVLVHGGAGDIAPSAHPAKLRGVKSAAKLGYRKLILGGSVVEAVEEAVRHMEKDEAFNAGYGSVLTFDGEVEMDAAIMDGRNLSAGCVSIAKNILHPITLARSVMEKTQHSYMAGKGLMRFAKQQGFEILPEGSLVTAAAEKALEDYKNSLNLTNVRFAEEYIYNAKEGEIQHEEFGEPGTVGAVAIDRFGNVAAATSTGGITGKLPGRIGDSPILGGGTYADNDMGAISATGHGESFMRFNVAQKILQLINLKSMHAQEATTIVLSAMIKKLGGTGGAITIDRKYNIGIFFTSKRMAWAYQKGECIHFGINQGEHNRDCQ